MRSTGHAQRALHGIVDQQTRDIYSREATPQNTYRAGYEQQPVRRDTCADGARHENHLLERELQRYREREGTPKARQRFAALSNLSAQIDNLEPKANDRHMKYDQKHHMRKAPIDRIRKNVDQTAGDRQHLRHADLRQPHALERKPRPALERGRLRGLILSCAASFRALGVAQAGGQHRGKKGAGIKPFVQRSGFFLRWFL